MRTGGLSREAGASQVRRPQKEEEHGDHHPGHQDHSDADATVTGGSWQLPKALCVGAVGLGLPELQQQRGELATDPPTRQGNQTVMGVGGHGVGRCRVDRQNTALELAQHACSPACNY